MDQQNENSQYDPNAQYVQPQYAQNGQYVQYQQPQPVKKKKKWWIPVIVILAILIIAALVLYFCFREKVVEWTNGKIGTVSVNEVELDEAVALTEPQEPSEKQISKYQKYVEDLYEDTYTGLSEEKKEYFLEVRSLIETVVDAQLSETELTIDNFESLFNETYDEISKSGAEKLACNETSENAVLSAIEDIYDTISPFEKTAYAAGTITVDNLLKSYALHNIATGLTLKNGYNDVALALEAVAGNMNPYCPNIAMLIANQMRQIDLDYDAEDMLLFAIEQNPYSESAWISLGNLYLDQARYDDAERCFNKAFVTAPQSGPANQGMMLVCLAKNDPKSAYLYMLEGAKEGYSTTITMAYNHFINLCGGQEKYLEWAGPILESYGVQNMMDFSRSRTAFDPTLDTPSQQLNLDRTFKLPTTAVDVINSFGDSLMATIEELKFYFSNIVGEIDADSLISEDGQVNLSALFESEGFQALFGTIGIDVDSNVAGRLSDAANHVDENGNVDLLGIIGALAGKDEIPDGDYAVDETQYYQENYEQECFWLSVLNDYYFYEYKKLTDKYYTEPSKVHMEEAMEITLSHSEKKTEDLSNKDPMQALVTMATGIVSNGSPIGADSSFTKARIDEMTELFCPMNGYIEQGYKEAIILAEEYWLFSNNILGYIADNTIYNKYHFERNALVANMASFFPLAGAMSNAMIAGLSSEWGGMSYNWYSGDELIGESSLNKYITGKSTAKFPKIPELPISGMGQAVKPPYVIYVKIPDPNKLLAAEPTDTPASPTDKPDDKPDDKPEDKPDGEPDGSDAPMTLEELDELQNGVSIDLNAEISTVVEKVEDGANGGIGFKIKKYLEVSVNPATRSFKVFAGGIIGGGGVEFNGKSSEVILYGQAGLNAGVGVSVSPGKNPKFSGNQQGYSGEWTNPPSLERLSASLNLGSVTAQGYVKGVFNLRKRQVTSAEIGAEGGFEVLGYGADATVSYDAIYSSKKETAKLIMGGVQATSTKYTALDD